MSDSLLAIAPVGPKPLLPKSVHTKLHVLYAQVPGVSCQNCNRPGQCCELTQVEVDADFATMYPLYAVEYLNIVDYVRTHFDADRQRELLTFTDERPRRCPFLTEVGGCSIHPVRPLTCRTYGVLNHKQQVQAVATVSEGQVPSNWVQAFLKIETHTVCEQTVLQESDKLGAHMEAMVSFDYERKLIEMGKTIEVPDGDRQKIFETTSGRPRPIRWTWGGFNALMQTPLSWAKKHFKQVWSSSFLAE